MAFLNEEYIPKDGKKKSVFFCKSFLSIHHHHKNTFCNFLMKLSSQIRSKNRLIFIPVSLCNYVTDVLIIREHPHVVHLIFHVHI